MKKTVLVTCLILAAGMAMAAKIMPVSGSWRYKMTVLVDTPEGVKTGSAVREVTSTWSGPRMEGLGGSRQTVRGEAVVVDLGERGVLYAIMMGTMSGVDYPYHVVFDTFPIPGEVPGAGGGTPEGVSYYSHLKNAKAVLDEDNYPLLVRFKDPKDPKTVELAYEQEVYERNKPHAHGLERKTRLKADHFEEMFGKGVKLKEITLEMTKEPITTGIEKYLPWLGEYYDKRLDGRRFGTIEAPDLFVNSLAAGAFSTELRPHEY